MKSVLEDLKKKMEAALEHFKNELRNIRTGKANPGMIEGIQLEVYGSSMRIRDLANITIPEPRQLLITPFDRQNTNAIGKAIEKANLGFMPQTDATGVRINIPPMTGEIRKKMEKLCDEESEKAKVSIRIVRRDANELVEKLKAAGEIPEDTANSLKKDIQKETDKFCKDVDDVSEKKKKELSTV